MKTMAGNSLFIPSFWGGNYSLRDLVALFKGHLSVYIALTAVAGHALAQNRLTLASLELGGWVLLLSCGAGMLNNVQDRIHDRRLARTRHRILARGDLGAEGAFMASAALILTAFLGLWLCFTSPLPLELGFVAVLLYNGVYTPMKHIGVRARFLAMVPGTICGMIPPAMGWTAVAKGGAVVDLSGLVTLMAGIGVWQYPHFLLVFLKERAATPSGQVLPVSAACPKQGLIHVFVWACLFSASMVLFLLRGWIASPSLSVLLFLVAMGLPLCLGVLFLSKKKSFRQFDLGFWTLNLGMLAFMVLILLDRI